MYTHTYECSIMNSPSQPSPQGLQHPPVLKSAAEAVARSLVRSVKGEPGTLEAGRAAKQWESWEPWEFSGEFSWDDHGMIMG